MIYVKKVYSNDNYILISRRTLFASEMTLGNMNHLKCVSLGVYFKYSKHISNGMPAGNYRQECEY